MESIYRFDVPGPLCDIAVDLLRVPSFDGGTTYCFALADAGDAVLLPVEAERLISDDGFGTVDDAIDAAAAVFADCLAGVGL